MKLKTLNPLLPLKKIFNAVKGRIEKTRALAQNDEQLTANIKNFMAAKFNREASFFEVEIKPTQFHQQGRLHKGKSIRVVMKEHVNDYSLVQRMSTELARQFTLTNNHLVGLVNGPAPKSEKKLAPKPAV